MAAFKVINQQPSRLTLGKGGASSLGNLIALMVFGAIAFVGLSSFLDSGGDLNPVVLLVGVIIAIVILSNLVNALRSTRVVLDANQATATRTDNFLAFPIRRQEMAFNLIRDLQVAYAGGSQRKSDLAPLWQLNLRGTDGSTLTVNERGTRAEMNALAQQMRPLLNRPLSGQSEPAASGSAPAALSSNPPYTPSAVVGSLFSNLAAFAQAAAESAAAPTISAFPSLGGNPAPLALDPNSPDAPYARASARLAQQEADASAPMAEASARLAASQRAASASDAPASAHLAADQRAAQQELAAANQQFTAAQIAAGAPYTAASAELAQQQMAAQSAMGFTMPPLLTMPQMPTLFSFAAALDLPSFAPLGAAPIPIAANPQPEVKQVQVTVGDAGDPRAGGSGPRAAAQDPQDASAQYRLARQLMSAGNWREAKTALERALGMNPADSMVQNDLGVVYLEQNNLTEAERAFRRALALDPFGSASRYNLGLALNRLGKRREAQEQFTLGAQTASRGEVKRFQNARQGVLQGPLSSPQTNIFREDSGG